MDDHLSTDTFYCNDCGADYTEAKLDIITKGKGKDAVTVRLVCQNHKEPEREPIPTFFCLRTPGSLIRA